MINIQPYLHKLEILQEWVNLKIDKRIPNMVVYTMSQNITTRPRRMGVHIISDRPEMTISERPMTFEEYYEHKTKQ